MEENKRGNFTKILSITIISILIVCLLLFICYFFLQNKVTNENVPTAQLNETINTTIENNTNQNSINQNSTNQELITIEPNLNEIKAEEAQTESENGTIASSYYYSQLDSNAKIIYDDLNENKKQLISGNYKIDYGTKFNTLLHTKNGKETLNIAFQSAWNAFSYDNVELFYIDVSKINLITETTTLGVIDTYRVYLGPGENANYFHSSFKGEEQVKQEKQAIEELRNKVIEATKEDDDFTKIKRIHNWLIRNLSYDETSANKYTIYGPLREAKGVCEGYARSFKYILDGVKIPCILVAGTATDEEGKTELHAWNYVQINQKWYAIDVTWDDPIITGGGELTDRYRYRYFLKGSKEFFKDHTENGTLSDNSIEFKFPILSEENYE